MPLLLLLLIPAGDKRETLACLAVITKMFFQSCFTPHFLLCTITLHLIFYWDSVTQSLNNQQQRKRTKEEFCKQNNDDSLLSCQSSSINNRHYRNKESMYKDGLPDRPSACNSYAERTHHDKKELSAIYDTRHKSIPNRKHRD